MGRDPTSHKILFYFVRLNSNKPYPQILVLRLFALHRTENAMHNDGQDG
jgi:hypothetical protein